MITIAKRFAMIVVILAAVIFAGCGQKTGPGFLGSGTLEATEVDVSALTGGTLLELTREEGQMVDRGDLLARIDVEKLEIQRRQQAAALEEVRANRVSAGASVAQASETLANTQVQYRRIKKLHAGGAATQEQYDDITTRLKLAKSGLSAARARHEALNARRAQIEAGIALLDRKIADGTVRSPLCGVVVEKYMEPGEVVAPGGRIYRIADMNSFWIDIYVAASDLGRIVIGQNVEVRVDAIADPVPGRIAWVSPKAEFTPKNAQTRKARSELVYAVKVLLEKGRDELKIGMPAEVYETGDKK